MSAPHVTIPRSLGLLVVTMECFLALALALTLGACSSAEATAPPVCRSVPLLISEPVRLVGYTEVCE